MGSRTIRSGPASRLATAFGWSGRMLGTIGVRDRAVFGGLDTEDGPTGISVNR